MIKEFDENKIKLLYLTNGVNGPGGLERVLSVKASYLADEMNYVIHIASLFGPVKPLFYEFSPKIQFHQLDVKRHPIMYIFSYIHKVLSLIKEVKPDIILVCDDGLKGLLFPLLIRTEIPKIYERHVSKNAEIKSEKLSVYKKIISRIKFKLMDFGGSKYEAFVVLTKGNTLEWNLSNMHIIPNPLSFYPNETELSDLRSKIVLAVGKQSFQKGYDRLLQAWENVIEYDRSWKLHIYGSFDPSENLEKLRKELKLEDSVSFFEPIKDIGSKYQNASIYVMSSRYEGFGMVLIEAMSYGIPCISFDCPYGPSDIIQSDRNGILVANGDINTLANSIVKLIKSPTLREDYGKMSRLDVEQFFPEVICQRWKLLFNELLINKS